ncbi:MAG: ParB/RepB/Spo0J family partition protein [Oscillospiraceae bacterium]|jgi:ParB family chromosome partitioning protein|nr:ParB/RepB/Spo0J family partition protein [Oscillospiraceae bacterium]
MNNIVSINPDLILPHPRNPRHSLGDLDELTASIKANGVMQNLTVIHAQGDGDETRYIVVIGHRRLAAAKLAGLTEVPCAVVEMDERTQLATMLAENMQRADLTLPEEVEGIQMMLDLGETVASVADITGLSETTVRRRAKLAEYDKGALAEAVQRGATIADYVELEKVKSAKERSALFEKIGTRDFNWAVKSAISLQESVERRPALKKAFAAIKAKEIKLSGQYSSKYLRIKDFQRNVIPDDWSWPTDFDKKKYYCVVDDRCSVLLTGRSDSKESAGPKEKQAQKALKERIAALEQITGQAKELREAWVKDYTPKKADAPKILRMLCLAAACHDFASSVDVSGLLGIEDPSPRYYLGLDGAETAAAKAGWDKLALALALAALKTDYRASFYNRSTGAYYGEDSFMPVIYANLAALGYPVSSEEKALCDGTHELYMPAAEAAK